MKMTTMSKFKAIWTPLDRSEEAPTGRKEVFSDDPGTLLMQLDFLALLAPSTVTLWGWSNDTQGGCWVPIHSSALDPIPDGL